MGGGGSLTPPIIYLDTWISNIDFLYTGNQRINANMVNNVGCFIVNGKEINSAEDQRQAFADYYEDLSIPKDDGYDSAYLELCTVRHKMISKLCQESSETADPFTAKEVKEAISKLNQKKSTR